MIKIIDINFQNQKSAVGCFLIKKEKNIVLIETGPSLYYNNIKSYLQQISIDIKDIKHVLVTHIHLDHSGGAWKFAKNGAKIYVHPIGAPHLENPERLISSASKIYGDKMKQLWGKVDNINANNIISVDHNETINIGNIEIKALHTPGHANHHIAWKYENNIFTGDIAGAKIDDGPVLPACPPPDIDLVKWEQSLNIIKEHKPKRLYLTHFGRHENISNHIQELKQELEIWSCWVKEKKDKILDNQSLVNEFNKFVYNNMKIKKIDDKLIYQYFAANPPYMSVTGLKRYWEKYG
tara:strand:+ start:1267 stop:2148 length:882 start_codon:yes stop_codon:yes gene_type:complete